MFAFVWAERGNHAVATLCWRLGASVTGFYAWLYAIPSVQDHAGTEASLRGYIGRHASEHHANDRVTI